MQSETRLRTYLGVWEPISRTGKEPFKASCVSRWPDTRVTPIRRRLLSTAWSNSPVTPTKLGPPIAEGLRSYFLRSAILLRLKASLIGDH